MNEQQKRNMVGTTIECPRDICESGKVYIWGYHPGGNPNHFINSEERFEVSDEVSGFFSVSIKEYESWQSNKE